MAEVSAIIVSKYILINRRCAMQKRIAILYDFDYTLTDGFMQQFGLMQDLGYNDVGEFFRACEETFGESDIDMCLSMMGGIYFMAKQRGKQVTREYLKSFGKDIVFYPGVEEWFDKINQIGKSHGFEIEHYIISSGLTEIVEGSLVSSKFKRIYANFFCYDANGQAYWPCQVVNYTSKTQYIYRVRKNALDDLKSLTKINAKMSDDEVLPFSNIIYIGDSQTDIPSFKVVKNSGGLSVCVYAENGYYGKEIAEKCFHEGRVNNFVLADYREGSELYNLIKNYIEKVIRKAEEKQIN